MLMKALLVGSGGREHAIAEALKRSNAEVYAFMSSNNPGIAKISEKAKIGNLADVSEIARFAKSVKPDFAVIGPEMPLFAGVADRLERMGISCVGPVKELAKLETSKCFTRMLLQNYGVPGSPYFKVFSYKDDIRHVGKFLDEVGDFVIKPDGLTGGKGVKLFGEHLKDKKEAVAYCRELFSKKENVVIEEKLEGEEFSLQCLVDGEHVVSTPAVQDHKRAFAGDKGPNTGGMGSYSFPNHILPFIKESDVKNAHAITEKVLAALREETGQLYKGVMYGGFMVTKNGIKLIEYNARFGDPEAMNIFPLLETDFAEICKDIANGTLSSSKVRFAKKATVCKYIVPEGYPEKAKLGKIELPETAAKTYYASVEQKEGGLYTKGSRAVAFVGIADSIEEAERIAEDACSRVKGNVYHRSDIGTKELIEKRISHMKTLRKLKSVIR